MVSSAVLVVAGHKTILLDVVRHPVPDCFHAILNRVSGGVYKVTSADQAIRSDELDCPAVILNLCANLFG